MRTCLLACGVPSDAQNLRGLQQAKPTATRRSGSGQGAAKVSQLADGFAGPADLRCPTWDVPFGTFGQGHRQDEQEQHSAVLALTDLSSNTENKPRPAPQSARVAALKWALRSQGLNSLHGYSSEGPSKQAARPCLLSADVVCVRNASTGNEYRIGSGTWGKQLRDTGEWLFCQAPDGGRSCSDAG